MELIFISGNLSIHERNGECNDPAVDPWKRRCTIVLVEFCYWLKRLVREVEKFTAKRRPETTLPTWTSAAGL